MKKIFCSYRISNEIERNLIKIGLEPIKLRGIDENFNNVLSYHVDMFCFNLDFESKTWIFYKSAYENNREVLDKLEINIILVDDLFEHKYPEYIGLNCAKIGDKLICAEKYINKEILRLSLDFGLKIVNVKQGYAKCNICCGNDFIITSDENIYKNFDCENKFEKLLIEKGGINLWGYNYGFIGGCSGFFRINNCDCLIFSGDLNKHKDYFKISEFCERKNVKIINLSKEMLRDYGGFFIIN